MALPKTLVYNDLTGDEIKHILAARFAELLSAVPYLQKHITLPRVKMTLEVQLECWADQARGENRTLSDAVEIRSESSPNESEPAAAGFYKTAIVDASAKGQPPDKVREDHGLPVPTPARSTEPWRNLAVSDQPEPVEGRRIVMDNGAIVDRTGQSADTRSGAVVIKQDFGPARERVNRDTAPKLRNQHGGGDVQPPNWNNKDE